MRCLGASGKEIDADVDKALVQFEKRSKMVRVSSTAAKAYSYSRMCSRQDLQSGESMVKVRFGSGARQWTTIIPQPLHLACRPEDKSRL